MKTYQIWGQFAPDDDEQEQPVTCSVFEKGQTMISHGVPILMEDFEKDFARSEGEALVLLREFQAPDSETAGMIFQTFMDGWWRIKEKERC